MKNRNGVQNGQGISGVPATFKMEQDNGFRYNPLLRSVKIPKRKRDVRGKTFGYNIIAYVYEEKGWDDRSCFEVDDAQK